MKNKVKSICSAHLSQVRIKFENMFDLFELIRVYFEKKTRYIRVHINSLSKLTRFQNS